MSPHTARALNTATLEYVLQDDPLLVFGGVFAYDRIPNCVTKYPCGYVFNTDRSDEPGEHWVSVYFGEDRKGEYFCPLGTEPYGALYEFMKKNSIKTVYNKTMIQFPLSSLCGYYCVYHLKRAARGYSITRTLNDFRYRDKRKNDAKVFAWVRREVLKRRRNGQQRGRRQTKTKL